MTRMLWMMAVAAPALGAGCGVGHKCQVPSEPVQADDGGMARCLRAEDCPRPSNGAVCLNDGPVQEPCVTCQDTSCVRHLPGNCQ